MNDDNKQKDAQDADGIAARAGRVLPAGGFGNFDPSLFVRSGRGARVTAEDGREYVDCLISSGPMILGHGHCEVVAAIKEQLDVGMTYFANNLAGLALAEEICGAVSCAEMVRFVSSGSEADMYAVRLARAHTGREKIIKFEGGFHGMSDEALMSLAPTRMQNFPRPVPDSAGILESVQDNVLIAPFNDADFVASLVAEQGDQIAGIIVEPLQRLIPPEPGFLEALREIATRHGIMLIFDEVVTGFRLEYGGAQAAYGVVPDICTLGKIIGGGLPLAAIAASREIMRHFDRGQVDADAFTIQMGTLNGNPLAAVAGLKTLEVMRRPGSYEKLRDNGGRLMRAMSDALDAHNIAHRIVGHPVLFDVVFTPGQVRNHRDVLKGDARKAACFNAAVRREGVLKSPTKVYPCLALDDADIEIATKAFAAGASDVAELDAGE